VVTCLEAQGMGYDFVTTCSRCDYYLQNKALNMKALTLPRSELSKMWQCTKMHKVGDLYHSSCAGTSYRPVIPNSNNSYICSDRGNSARHSATKRVRLFSPIPNSSGYCMDATEVDPSPDASIINERALAVQYDTLKESNALLQLERDRAMKEKEDAEKDRNVAVEQRDRAYIECDTAKAARHRAVVERDCALNRLDSQARISAELENRYVVLEGELNSLKQKFDALEASHAKLEQEKENSTALISTFSDNVSRLQTRVAALESQAVRSTNMTVKNTGNQMRYISLFLSKLFPELTKKEREKELFYILYGSKKSFREYVKSIIKVEVLPEMRKAICQEIKKHYAAWRFLAVMDCSNQSLNQVSCLFF
jgi:hypothetical protein